MGPHTVWSHADEPSSERTGEIVATLISDDVIIGMHDHAAGRTSAQSSPTSGSAQAFESPTAVSPAWTTAPAVMPFVVPGQDIHLGKGEHPGWQYFDVVVRSARGVQRRDRVKYGPAGRSDGWPPGLGRMHPRRLEEHSVTVLIQGHVGERVRDRMVGRACGHGTNDAAIAATSHWSGRDAGKCLPFYPPLSRSSSG